jgi:hypothetical protein
MVSEQDNLVLYPMSDDEDECADDDNGVDDEIICPATTCRVIIPTEPGDDCVIGTTHPSVIIHGLDADPNSHDSTSDQVEKFAEAMKEPPNFIPLDKE